MRTGLIRRWFPIAFGVIIIGLGATHSLDFNNLAVTASLLCGIGFALTVLVVAPSLDVERKILSIVRGKLIVTRLERERAWAEKFKMQEKAAALNAQITEINEALLLEEELIQARKEKRADRIADLTEQLKEAKIHIAEESQESPAVILGAGGIYGIIMGMGISDALTNYSERVSNGITGQLNSTIISHSTNSTTLPNSILELTAGTPFDLAYAFRLVGFLVTIVPFVHGAILTFSNRWYRDTDGKDHFGLSLVFFIVAFVQTVIFLFVALNIEDGTLFVLFLFILLLLNLLWVPIQTKLTTSYLERNDIFLNEWAILNFNTMAFVLVFLLAGPMLIYGPRGIDDNSWLNLLIFLVLLFRTVADYAIGWRKIYNWTQK